MKNKNGNYPYYEVKQIFSIEDMLQKASKEAGEKPVIKYKNSKKGIEAITYSEFYKLTNKLERAIGLISEKDSHIACIGENSFKWILTYLSVLKSDKVFVPIDKELPISDVCNVLNHSDSEVLFYSGRFEEKIEEIAPNCPNIKFFVGFDLEKSEGNKVSFQKLLEKGKELPILKKDGERDIRTLKMIVYTSGTTGRAKGVMLSEENLVSMVYYGLRISKVYGSCLSILPYHHTYEAVAGLLVSMHNHATIAINDRLMNVLSNLKLYKPEYIYVVPAFAELFYERIMRNVKKEGKERLFSISLILSNALRKIGIDARRKFFKDIHEAFGGNLIKIVTGGAPLRQELGEFFDAVGFDIVNGYGITECSPLIAANRDEFNDYKTVGVPVECLQVKLENVNADGFGEITVKGKTVMLGYYKNKELSDEVLKDGWFKTGDYGRFDDFGRLMITGRKKNIIVLKNGKNIFPEEIEGYIARISYVTDVIVKGEKDKNGDEVGLTAEVYCEEKITEDALKADIASVCEELPTYKKITSVIIRDREFTKTTTAKIIR